MAKCTAEMTDQEVLDHYIPGEGLPPSSEIDAGGNVPALAKELLEPQVYPTSADAGKALDLPYRCNRLDLVHANGRRGGSNHHPAEHGTTQST